MKFVKTFVGIMLLIITVAVVNYLGAVTGITLCALIAFGPDITDMRKKLGNAVYSKNHYGNFKRKLVKPINPRSPAQTDIRTKLKGLAQGFKGLTQAQILAWNALGKQILLKNRLGQPKKLTGEASYIAYNLNILAAGGNVIPNAPAISANVVAIVSGVTIGMASGALTMAYTPGSVATNKVIVRSSGVVSPGKTYNSQFKTFHTFASNGTSPETMTSAWVAKFGTAPAAGAVIFFEYRVVDSLTGFTTLYEKVRIVTT